MSGAGPQVLATVAVSPLRLGLAIVVQGVLGVLLIAVALATPAVEPGFRVILVGIGGLAVWNGWALWRTGRRRLELTPEALGDDRGRRLCAISDVAAVSRGPLALKPARGFALILREPADRAWVPGLWWRLGRRLGVGGVTSATETRLMAEVIEALVADRAGDDR